MTSLPMTSSATYGNQDSPCFRFFSEQFLSFCINVKNPSTCLIFVFERQISSSTLHSVHFYCFITEIMLTWRKILQQQQKQCIIRNWVVVRSTTRENSDIILSYSFMFAETLVHSEVKVVIEKLSGVTTCKSCQPFSYPRFMNGLWGFCPWCFK